MKTNKTTKVQIYLTADEQQVILKKMPLGASLSRWLGQIIMKALNVKSINTSSRRWDKE